MSTLFGSLAARALGSHTHLTPRKPAHFEGAGATWSDVAARWNPEENAEAAELGSARDAVEAGSHSPLQPHGTVAARHDEGQPQNTLPSDVLSTEAGHAPSMPHRAELFWDPVVVETRRTASDAQPAAEADRSGVARDDAMASHFSSFDPAPRKSEPHVQPNRISGPMTRSTPPNNLGIGSEVNTAARSGTRRSANSVGPTGPLPVNPLPVSALPVSPLPIEPLPIEPLPIEPRSDDQRAAHQAHGVAASDRSFDATIKRSPNAGPRATSTGAELVRERDVADAPIPAPAEKRTSLVWEPAASVSLERTQSSVRERTVDTPATRREQHRTPPAEADSLEAPVVHVHIGRVDVRMLPPSPVAPRAARALPEPELGLDAYLRSRGRPAP